MAFLQAPGIGTWRGDTVEMSMIHGENWRKYGLDDMDDLDDL